MLNWIVLNQTKALHYQIVMSVARRESTVSAVIIVHFLQQQKFPSGIGNNYDANLKLMLINMLMTNCSAARNFWVLKANNNIRQQN